LDVEISRQNKQEKKKKIAKPPKTGDPKVFGVFCFMVRSSRWKKRSGGASQKERTGVRRLQT